MKIHVTEEDIKHGERMICGHCPIALAVKRASGTEDVVVGPISISIGNLFMFLPKAAKQFICRFDDGKPVSPFSFEVTAVPDSEEVAA